MTKEEEVASLKERVKDGNQKLNEAWSQICQIDLNSQRWKDEIEKWHQANEKLSAMCTQLKALGFEDCLYIENGVKTKKCLGADPIGCRVCPSRRHYWETELMELPSAGQGELSGL